MPHDCYSRLSGRIGRLAEEGIFLNLSLEKRGKGRFYGE
jgi:hypothetical protein